MPMHNIGKVSVNASVLYKNQEIRNKTHMWTFQLISLFLLRENSKNAFSIFIFILMAGVFVSQEELKLLIGSYFTNYSNTITHQAEIFQEKLSTIIIFIPCKLCVNLWTFLFFGLTNVVQQSAYAQKPICECLSSVRRSSFTEPNWENHTVTLAAF